MDRRRLLVVLSLAAAATLAASVGGAETPQPAAAEKAAYERARPIFEKHCASCHTTAGKGKRKKKALRHFSMDSYPFGGHHAAEIGEEIREVLGVTGEKPKMPADRPGSVTGADLDAIVEWSKAFDRAHPEDGAAETQGGHP